MSARIGLKRHSVQVVQPDPLWETLFQAEAASLWASIHDLVLQIEHVGSTSVPQLPAKPILDIAVAVSAKTFIPAITERLLQRSYIDRGDSGADGGYLLVKESEPAIRIVHLHIVEESDEQWSHYLKFRETLRQNSALREQYASLKLKLATKYANNRQAYTAAKHDFIQSVLAK